MRSGWGNVLCSGLFFIVTKMIKMIKMINIFFLCSQILDIKKLRKYLDNLQALC